MSDFRDKTLIGITWNVMNRVAWQAILVLTNIILARILIPRDFGLMAMVAVVTLFAGILAELGLGTALIQFPRVEELLAQTFGTTDERSHT